MKCNPKKSKTDAYLAIFEVATGIEFKIPRSKIFSKPPKGHHSVKGVGKYSPLTTISYNGATAYTGTPMKNEEEVSELRIKAPGFAFSEYAIYDNCQIKPVFLVKVNFKFK